MYRQFYFTSDSTHYKIYFMRVVNKSSGEGGLTCSFVDKEVTQFIQYKKRQSKVPRKIVIPYTYWSTAFRWMLGLWTQAVLDNKGNKIDESATNLVWIGHLVSAPKVAAGDTQLPISLPLGTMSSNSLVPMLQGIMHHNFPCLNTNIGYSSDGTSLLSPDPTKSPSPHSFFDQTIWHRQYHSTQKCCVTFWSTWGFSHTEWRISTPFTAVRVLYLEGVTYDPLSESHTCHMVVDLYNYNGAKLTTVKREGDMKPLSIAIVSANFTMISKARWPNLYYHNLYTV